MLDMAVLFERFVSRLVGEWAHGQGLRSELQGPDRGALLDAAGAVYRQVRPDIIVEI